MTIACRINQTVSRRSFLQNAGAAGAGGTAAGPAQRQAHPSDRATLPQRVLGRTGADKCPP